MEKAVNITLNDQLNKDIIAILLFGSHADRTNTPRSDIDICVVFKKDLSLKEATKFRIRNSGCMSDKIDLQVFNVLPSKIKKEIAINHRILYRNNEFNNIAFTTEYSK